MSVNDAPIYVYVKVSFLEYYLKWVTAFFVPITTHISNLLCNINLYMCNINFYDYLDITSINWKKYFEKIQKKSICAQKWMWISYYIFEISNTHRILLYDKIML